MKLTRTMDAGPALLRKMARAAIGSVVFVLLAAACGASTTTLPSDTANEALAEPALSQASEPTSAPQPTAAEPTPAPEPTLAPEPTPVAEAAAPSPAAETEVVFWGSELEPGDCFNRVEGNPSFTPPEIVSCDELHDEELFAYEQWDAAANAAYPEEFDTQVWDQLCDLALFEFAEVHFTELPAVPFSLFPAEDEWAAGDRWVGCSIGAKDEGDQKIGTMAGGTLTTNDIIAARVNFRVEDEPVQDWMVFAQHDWLETAGALTNLQFDIPLRRPFAGPKGFIFNATAADDDGYANTTWAYNWETAELSDLGSPLPGYEIASTMVTPDGAVLFAARETPTDDFDLWIMPPDSAPVVLIGGEGDQNFPTMSLDATTIVYQSGGDIWVANVDGSGQVQLTDTEASEWESVISPDGRTVLFVSNRTGNDDIWAVNIDGGEAVNLTNHPADELWPVFSPDGQHIYFSSDRMDPVDDVSVLMVMNADGSNPSWFAASPSAQAVVVDPEVAQQVKRLTPTLAERHTYELIAGEPGTSLSWTDSSERLTVELPAGWYVSELTDKPGFVVSPRIDYYFEEWEIDGVLVELFDGDTREEFFGRYDGTDAARLCEQTSGSDGIGSFSDDIDGLSGNYDCGTEGAGVGVLLFYNNATQVGITFEGQRDNFPDAGVDDQTLFDLFESLTWK